MDHTEFKEIVKKGRLENTYLFLGKEDYLMNECIKLVKAKYVEGSLETLNFTLLDGERASYDVLVNACETLPFMSQKKIIVLKGINIFIEKEDISIKDELYRYLEKLGDHICLILMDNQDELKKSTKIYKLYNKNKRVVEFNKLKGKHLSLWVEKLLKQYNKSMTYSDINYFLQNSSYLSRNIVSTLYDLENELKKLIDFSTNTEITKEDIDYILIKSLDNNIFDLLSALNEEDIDGSLKIFNEIYLSNEPIQKILFMITRQIRLLLAYKLYKNKGYTEGDIQGKLQIKPYEFSKISIASRNFKTEDLEKSLNSILEVDRKLKTTSINDKIEMEILIVNLGKKK